MVKIKNFKRILILGSPGAGKTTFCKELSHILQLPTYHLDDYYWLRNWQRIDVKLWHNTLFNLCNKPTWIIEGNHFNTLERRLPYSEIAILLDYPVWLCLWRFCKRAVKRFFYSNENLPKNIKNDTSYKPKITIEWHLIKLILSFKFLIRPKMLKLIKSHQVKLVILPNRKLTKAFLLSLLYEK